MDFNHEVVSDTARETIELDKMEYINSWFLMGSPVPITLITVSYLLFVLKLGPEFMKNRKPFQLRNVIRLYNVIQVAISLGLLHISLSLTSKYGLLPKTCNMDTDAKRLMITSGIYTYFAAKVTELLDTVFFVLRKKDNQVTFLHVYHHTLMVLVSWTVLKYEPTYLAVFLGVFNSFVHVIMYTYYGLASFPSLTKYLWWKKYITSLQLIQFLSILIHFCMYHAISDCTPSYIMTFTMAFNLSLFMYMFGKFYVNTYNKKNGGVKEELNRRGKKNAEVGNANSISKGVGKKTEEYSFETAYLNSNIAVNRKHTSIGNS